MVSGRKPITENESGHAERIEELRRLTPFMIDGQMAVTASRTHDHGRSRRLLARW